MVTEQLAQISGLSVRTVQRIEQDQKAGLGSLICLDYLGFWVLIENDVNFKSV